MGHWGGNCGPGWVLHWMSLFRNTEGLNKHLCPSHLWKCPVLFLFAERTCWPQTEAASGHKPPLNRVRLCQSIPFQLNSGKVFSFVALRKKKCIAQSHLLTQGVFSRLLAGGKYELYVWSVYHQNSAESEHQQRSTHVFSFNICLQYKNEK